MPISAGEALQILSTLQHMEQSEMSGQRQSFDQGTSAREAYATSHPEAEELPEDVRRSISPGMTAETQPMLGESLTKTAANSRQRLMLMQQADENAKVTELLQGMADSGILPEKLRPHLNALLGIAAKRNVEHMKNLESMFPRAAKGAGRGGATPSEAALEQFSFPGAQGAPPKR